jgi:hypothetical protein
MKFRRQHLLYLALALCAAALLLVYLVPGVVFGQTADPRADNARAFHIDASGKVDGVELVYVERPESTYQLVQARLIDEASAGGNTVAKFVVVDCFGTPISENVWLAWPWPTLDGGRLLPGNQNSEHMIVNKYDGAQGEIGPLAIYVGDGAGRIISDEIGGLGLPNGRHVSFYLAFRKRCGLLPTATPVPVVTTPTPVVPTSTPGPSPTPGPDTATLHADLVQLHADALSIQGLLQQILDRILQGKVLYIPAVQP